MWHTITTLSGTVRCTLWLAAVIELIQSASALAIELQSGSVTQLVELINKARTPTVQRVSALEAENDVLRKQLADAQRQRPAKKAKEGAESSEEDEDEEAEPQAEEVIANPIHDYISMLEGLVRLILYCVMFIF